MFASLHITSNYTTTKQLTKIKYYITRLPVFFAKTYAGKLERKLTLVCLIRYIKLVYKANKVNQSCKKKFPTIIKRKNSKIMKKSTM